MRGAGEDILLEFLAAKVAQPAVGLDNALLGVVAKEAHHRNDPAPILLDGVHLARPVWVVYSNVKWERGLSEATDGLQNGALMLKSGGRGGGRQR